MDARNSEWFEKHRKDIEFFNRKLPSLLQSAESRGKFFIVSNECLIDAYDTFEEALREATERLGQEEYIIQQASDEADTVGFLYDQIYGDRPE